MVKIIRGSHEIKVSQKSFKNIFEPLGYTLVEEKKVIKAKNNEPDKKIENPQKGGKKQED